MIGVILVCVLPNRSFKVDMADLVPEPNYAQMSAQLTARAQAQHANVEALEKLVALHERGFISAQDFETKKADLIARI